ncbi:MAG: 4-hydroxy-3-methylbut-2-enyl diphosphate reductase, partial [Pseudomonadota bacterium]|nr:4-hydroxy-3-methylbut-2-enyl diphosphate reductase [Pseudomonadota bacterium]
KEAWLKGCERIGVTAGASAPETLVVGVIEHLERLGGELVGGFHRQDEGVSFPLPVTLRTASADAGC